MKHELNTTSKNIQRGEKIHLIFSSLKIRNESLRVKILRAMVEGEILTRGWKIEVNFKGDI